MGYEFTSRIRYSEADQNQLLTIDHMADYFQDCTVFHDEAAGMGMDYWIAQRKMWVLTSWKILFFRRPKCGETVTTRTDAILCKGFKGLRNFTMRDEQGQMLCAAFSKWALLDTDTGRPTRIAPEEGEAYGTSAPIPMEEDKERITIPEDADRLNPIEITQQHLDTNHHVNNAQYIRMALNLLPEDLDVRCMRVSYHRSATLGDRLTPKICTEEKSVKGVFENEAGEPCVYFQFDGTLSEKDAAVQNL